MSAERIDKRPEHPLLARILDVAMSSLDEVRTRVVPKARGLVLEVGLGTGLNLPHYGDVERLIAVEPDPFMMRRARKRAQSMKAPVLLLAASGEALPCPDDTFDDVVMTFTLCTVPHPDRALAELKRVLKPGGRVFWAEHVRARGTAARRLQDVVTPAWRRLSGNCHLNRDAACALEEAGFLLEGTEGAGRQSWTLAPVVYGVATKPRTGGA